jgi:hypothetical protein
MTDDNSIARCHECKRPLTVIDYDSAFGNAAELIIANGAYCQEPDDSLGRVRDRAH